MHRKVKDVHVLHVLGKIYIEKIMACVILKEGKTMTHEEHKEYVSSHMAEHKTSRYVDFISEFPMNTVGKILKYKMPEERL